jgi:putative pyruvate formate lyase activating enzyme
MSEGFVPAYHELLAGGELKRRVEAARELLRACILCPRECRVNRLDGERGACRTGEQPIVSSHGPHFGEESPLVGQGGSGTIFLTNCNLACIFCQNCDISQLGYGDEVDTKSLTEMMLSLERRGCHNINWVTPTHQMPQLLAALEIAAEAGLDRPVVYNCGGYESLEALRLLDGIVDIYMPDAKYGDNESASRLSGVPDYWDRCRQTLAEMHRQVGDLVIDNRGVARRGLLVRHLVLPNNLAATQAVVRFLADLSKNTYVNVMAQYHPCHRAAEEPAVNRPLSREEYHRAVRWALEAGLERLDERFFHI